MLSTFGKAAAIASSTQRLCRCLQACSSFPVFVTTQPYLCWHLLLLKGELSGLVWEPEYTVSEWICMNLDQKKPSDSAALTVLESVISLLHNQGGKNDCNSESVKLGVTVNSSPLQLHLFSENLLTAEPREIISDASVAAGTWVRAPQQTVGHWKSLPFSSCFPDRWSGSLQDCG